MEALARLRNCPMSARKMRLVVVNIRGKSVDDALNILKFTNKEAAIWLEKVVLSAFSNWANKSEVDNPEDYKLKIKTAFVDGGSSIKRFRPAPHGRANRIRKRMNHVTIVVENQVNIEE